MVTRLRKRKAQTGRALNAMLLFGEVVDVALKAEAVKGCVMRSVLCKKISDSMWLVGHKRQVLIHVFRLDFFQLSQISSVFMRMFGTDSSWLSRRLRQNTKKKLAFWDSRV